MDDNEFLFTSRRAFLCKTGLLTGGLFLEAAKLKQSLFPNNAASSQELPCRILGKTQVPLTTLSLDTTPCGCATNISSGQIAHIVNEALNQGINCIDTARTSGNAEEGIGMALGRRRCDVFLSTKVWADTVADAERSLSTSLRTLRTDYVDLLYFQNLGTLNFEKATASDGVFTWLVAQKQSGKTRFIGISGHNLSERFPDFITTGQLDAIMMVLNFVDRYIYAFEDKILPLARSYDLGIVAMKVFGGIRGGFRRYSGPKAPPQLPEEYLQLAMRYALNLPGVTTANIGMHNVDQVCRNVAMARNIKPLTIEEQNKLENLGRQLAQHWRPHFGPIFSTSKTI